MMRKKAMGSELLLRQPESQMPQTPFEGPACSETALGFFGRAPRTPAVAGGPEIFPVKHEVRGLNHKANLLNAFCLLSTETSLSVFRGNVCHQTP